MKNNNLDPIRYQDEKGIWCLEEFRDVPGYEGIYQVSDLCRMKTLSRKVKLPSRNCYRQLKTKIMSLSVNSGYLQASLHKDGISEIIRVHVLVGIVFIPNPYKLPFLNHKNGIKIDSRKNNLEWCTHLENMQHAFRTGLVPNGERNHKAKLTDEQVKVMKRLFRINPKTNQSAVARKLNISRSVVNAIYKNRKWKYIN